MELFFWMMGLIAGLMFYVGIKAQQKFLTEWLDFFWLTVAGVTTGSTLFFKVSLAFNCFADEAVRVFALQWPWALAVVFSAPALLFHLGRRIGRL